MLTAQDIKQKLVTALKNCGVFDSVLTPADDRKNSVIMNEPSAAVYYIGSSLSEDNNIQTTPISFSVYMKFLKTGINETVDDISLAIDAIKTLEPESLKQMKISEGNKHHAMYQIDVTFNGCKND